MRYRFKYNDNHFNCELSKYSNFKILRDDARLKGFTEGIMIFKRRAMICCLRKSFLNKKTDRLKNG